MANIKSQIKRNRQNEKRRLRNRSFRGSARTAVKDARAALASNTETAASVNAALSALDKAAQKGAIHPRNAARRKGRLMKAAAALGIQPKAVVSEPIAPVDVEKMEKKEVEKKPTRAAKEEKPAKEAKPKKPAEKKPAEKKPAAKKTAKK